jgi:hypothetical protein
MAARSHKPRGPRPGWRTQLAEPTPPPIYHHPLIAISLILMLGSLAQMGIWLASARIAAAATVPPATTLIHGWLYDAVSSTLSTWLGSGSDHQPVLFAITLVVGLVSTAAWYLAVRIALGPGWGLWTAMLWAAHPAFAFLIQRPSPLVAVVALTPVVFLGLVWFNKSKRWIAAATLSGAALGLLTLCGTMGLAVIPAALLAIVLGRQSRLHRGLGCVITLLVCAGVVVPWLLIIPTSVGPSRFTQRLSLDWWGRLIDDPALAAQAKTWTAGDGSRSSPVWFLADEARAHPLHMTKWFGHRFGRTLYATLDGRLERPLLALQLATLLPALWGFRVALRHRAWRWAACLASAFVAVAWLLAALIEPLARNLAPVGAIAILFALLGVADLYERTFGRRLGREPRTRWRRRLA